MVYGVMGQAWDLLYNDFVIWTDTVSGSEVTFGAVLLVFIIGFYVVYRMVGS